MQKKNRKIRQALYKKRKRETPGSRAEKQMKERKKLGKPSVKKTKMGNSVFGGCKTLYKKEEKGNYTFES